MQAGGGFYGARAGGGEPPRAPPSPREQKLMDVLLRAREEHVTTVLKCVGGWPFEEQANLANWRAVLDRLHALLRRALVRCPRLVLVAPELDEDKKEDEKMEVEATGAAENELTEQVYEILRFTALLLENAASKAQYPSTELVVAFLSARNERVAFEATHVAAMLALPPALHRFTIDPSSVSETSASKSALLRRRLLVVAQGHGALNSNLDVVDYLTAARTSAAAYQYSFQFYGTSGSQTGSEVRAEVITIPIPELTSQSEEADRAGESSLDTDSAYISAKACESLISEFNVPKKLHFQLYTKIRACYSSRSKAAREAIILERMYALLALFTIFGDSTDVINYIEQNAELTRGIVELVRVEVCDKIPNRIRIAALLVLTALVNDRVGRAGGMGVLGRQSNVLSALGVAKGAPHGVFPSLVRFCMSELENATAKSGGSRRNSATAATTPGETTGSSAISPARTSSEADTDMDMSLAVAFVQATTDLLSPEEAEVVGGPAFRNPLGTITEAKLCWVESVLQLLSAVVSIQSGASVLTENGVVPALLHSITIPSVSAFHTTIVTQCVQSLEITVSNHSAAANLYKDLNGVGILTDRLASECASVNVGATTQQQLGEAKGSLIISILAALSMSFHSQGIMSAGATSRVIRDGSVLSKVLFKILSHVDAFSPVVFAQAAMVVSDVINNDPSSVNHVHASGIADVFLQTMTRWNVEELYPSQILRPSSSELLIAVPTVLNALSLTTNHAEKVAKYDPLMHLLDMFALPQYSEDESADCFQGDVASVVGAGIFELMRHVPSTQNSAVQAAVHAIKKIVRFAEEKVGKSQPLVTDEAWQQQYDTLLRMTTHLADLLEPLLSKSEHASYFADLGGVQSLLKLYQLILPSTSSFLSSGQTSAGSNHSQSSMRHHPAAQAITLALRTYASQQPTNLLTTIVKEMNAQLDTLRAARAKIGLPWYLSESGEGAESILCSLPDLDLTTLFNSSADGVKTEAAKVALTGDYLRVLAMIEWLCLVLIWTLDTAHGHLQSRRWFTEFSSKSTQLVLARLFSVDRSVQFERANLAALQQKQKHLVHEGGVSEPKGKATGLWKVGSLLLLRFAIVARNLLSAYGKAFFSASLQHRRSDDASAPLAPHARTLAKTVALTLERHLLYVISESRANQIDAFVQQYYLTFLLETITMVVFEGKKKQVNTLVLLQLLKPIDDKTAEASFNEDVAMTSGEQDILPSTETPVNTVSTGATFTASNLIGIIMNIIQRFFALSFESETADSSGKLSPSRMSLSSFRIAAGLLSRVSNLDVISASPMTAALVADNEMGRSGEAHDKFEPQVLSVELHRLCLRTFLTVWANPKLSDLPTEYIISDVLPVAMTLLKNRIDRDADGRDEPRDSLSGVGDNSVDFFGEALNLRRALFGGGRPTERRTTSRQAFTVDSNIVDNLVSMGFSRRRVEHALRRIQVNDVELAMEWILEHEEEDINTDDIDSSSEVNADGDVQSVTSTQAEDSEQKQHENELHALYAQLRGSFEDTCVQIMLVHGNSIVVAGDSAKTPYPGQQLVKMIAEYFSYLLGQSSAERDTVISKLNTAILECFSESASTPKDERLLTMLVHLLALLLRLNPYARGVYLTQSPSSSDKLLSMVATTSADATGGVSTSLAPTLLVMDALASARSVNGSDPASPELIATTAEDVKMTDDDKDSDNQSGSLEFERKLVKMCLDLLKNSRGTLDQTSAHAVWQLLARVTLKFELASYFYLHGGVDAILSVQDSVFSGYHDLTCAVLSHVLESPEVLEQMMREKISRAMSKLATRFGSPRQMRITPRALLMEVAPVAARNEDVFVRALKHSVEVKKTELGRTYVVPIKEKSDARNAESRATAASTDQPVDDDMAGDKKAPAHHRFPKEYKHHAQAIVEKIIDKIRMLWIEERRGVTDSKKLDTDGASTCVCVGMYLRLLVHLVMQFPLCASILAKARYSHETREPFVRVVLQDFLPCPELCNFAAVRRALKDGGLYGGNDNNSTEADSLISDVGTFVNNRTRSRVRNAHRLLVSIGSQSSEGSKVIILEVVHLLQRWPQRLTVGDAGILGLDVEVSSSSSEPDLSVRDEVALSALHAWAGLIMSILWPKGSSKGFALDKVVLGGGLKGQHSFVTLLADTLRKIDLEHPLAHATCSMLLRPLATLTRPFVTQRIRRLLKKRSEGGEASSTETLEHLGTSVQDNAAEGGSSGAGSHQDVGVASIPSHEVAAGHTPEPLIAEDVSDDVAMRSPSSAVEDHEMQEDVDSDGEQSNHSSESGDSIDDRPREEQEEDDIEEDEDDEDDDDEDEDDDDDDEDEDEDDDDEEEDEDEVRMHIRSSRRGDRHASNQRNAGNRLWGSLDSELSVLDALDEVDEEEFSYLNMLDDEAAFAEEQNRRVRRASRQSEEASRGESTVATGVTRSLADALGLRGAAENRLPNSQTQVLTFGNEDGDESDNTTSADASAESGQTLSSRGGSVRDLGTSRNSLSASSLLQYIEELPDMGDDVFFFDSLMDELPIPSRGRQDRNSSRGNTVSDGASLHPLLRMDNSDNLLGGDSLRGGSDRLPLPRHSSLLRELQELTEQVQNHMPVSITGSRGGRIGGRDQLSRGGRGRPPSRNNRLSIVSNLLNEFSLNSLQMNSSRGNPLRMRRGDRDIFGAPARGLRGDSGMNATWSWGPGLQNEDLDVRSVASRLEQRITESITDSTEEPATGSTPHPETSSAPVANNDEAVPMSEVESSPQEPNEDVDTDVATPRGSDHTASESSRTSAAANETSVTRGDPSRTTIDLTNSATEAGDTASVVDLTSTFGESSLRSPDESDTDSHLATASVTTLEDTPTTENSSAVPPPAPTTTTSMADPMMGFTLDLSGFNLPPALNATEPQQTQPQEQQQPVNTAGVHEDESKTEEDVSATGDQTTTEATAEESAGGFQCPEGMDPEVFDSLPPDVQAEIIAQFEPTPSPAAPQSDAATPSGTEGMSQLEIDMANSSFDRETLEALPPDIRAEVLENERREREAAAAAAAAPADVSRAQEMDNASFVASLAPELREEILITCDDAFLQTLPSQVRAEATVLRERAAFRTTYREPDLGGGPDLMALPHDIFTRPSLRRTQTSAAGGDGGSGSRRRPRTFYHDLYNDRRGRREGERHHHHHSSSHKGMLRVDKDEDEVESDRICDERCVKGLLRLLFMAQSVIQNRVLQRLIANICMYPLTRHSVRTNLLRIVTLPLESPLVPSTDLDDSFPPTHLYGCNGATNRQLTTSNALVVSPDVVSRMLHVLVSLAKYNPRFTIEMLQAHGMRRKLYSVSDAKREDERGVSVLIDLLSVPVVNRNGTNLDTLLELLELVLSPLERLPKSTSTESTESVKVEAPANSDVQVDASVSGASGASNEGAATSTAEPGAAPESHHHHGGEWVTVPSVELDSKRMQNIVAVLGMDICTPQMQERTLAILKLLNQVTTNRKLVVAAIVGLASELARVDRYKPAFPSASTAYNSVTSMMLHYETSAVLFSAQDELKLLRLLHTLSDICVSTAEFTDCCQTIGLDSLWDALSESLEEARSNGGLDDQDVAGAQKKEAATGHSTEDENADGMVIEGKSAGASCAMAALLARFLPMVEAFFVVNARDAASMTLSVPDTSEREEAVVAALRSGGFDSAEANMLSGGDGNAESNTAASSTGSRSLERASSTSSEVGESMRLANFVEANRVLLNILVREKPSLLDSSLAALIKIPRCRAYLDFDNKRTYFHSAMKKLRQTALRSHGGSASVRIPVRRDHIFEDSYYALRMRSGNELRRKLHISFTNEEGIDAGGVTREWYVILAREIFNPNYVLFTSAADSPTFQPNPLSYVNKDHLSYFEFVGKVIGKAVADGQLLDAHFTRSFYKHMLQLPISYHDMEAIDPEYYRNLHSILDHNIEDLGLELTFSAEQSNFGKTEIVDLIPNGRNVAVTDANKMEYVKLVTHHRMATGIRQQIDAFLQGFHQLVPPEMIAIFNENELELLISGMPEIDIDDLKANTEYANYKPTDSVIRWFWNVLYAFTQEERALFLQFVTGTSKVPLEGFKALEGMRGTQKFNIHKAFGNNKALPSAHTCFNQLDLPEYESEEKLKQCLLLAIREGSEGFGFG